MSTPLPSAHDRWTHHPDRLQIDVYSIALLSHFLPNEPSHAHAVFLEPHPDGGLVASILLDGVLVAAYDEDGTVGAPGAIVITNDELNRILRQEVDENGAMDEAYRLVAADHRGSGALAFCAFGSDPGRSPRVLSITPREHIHQDLGPGPAAADPTLPTLRLLSGRPRKAGKATASAGLSIPTSILSGAATLLETIGKKHDLIEAVSTKRGLLVSFESEPNLLILIPTVSFGAAAARGLQWLAGIQCPWRWTEPVESHGLH